MYIRDRLYLGTLISIILVVILVSVISLTSNEIAKKYREHDLVMDVRTDVSELDIVTDEYLLHREKRMEQQWHLKYDSMREIIKEEKSIEPVRADCVALGDLFSQVTANYKKRQRLIQEGASQEEINVSMLLEERLVAQLLIKSHSIITSAFELAKKVDVEITKNQETANALTLTLVLILAATITTVSLITARSISEPLGKLTKGAEIIGNGDLEHRIDVKSKDEIGKLATAFNQMTNQLMASEQQLKASNQQLRASEQQLKASNQQLRASEQQLKASNQQLQASEQQLKASNQQLQAGEQRLKASNQQLRANEQQLRTEIAERKKAQEELLKLSNAVTQSPSGVVITDINGDIEYVNPNFTELTGYTLKEVMGKNPRILKSGETSLEEYKYLWDTITSGKTWRGEFHNKRKDGGLYWEDATISSVKNSEGVITYFMKVSKDITGRKKMEEEREKHLHDLEVFYKANINREEWVLELKKKIKELEEKLGGESDNG